MRTPTTIEPAVLEQRLGPRRWAEVRRATWRGDAVTDPASAAAVLHVARRERGAIATASWSFLVLGLAGTVVAQQAEDTWRWALLVLAGVGLAGTLFGLVRLRRQIGCHRELADEGALRAVVAGDE